LRGYEAGARGGTGGGGGNIIKPAE
jgi:hypothetical protein